MLERDIFTAESKIKDTLYHGTTKAGLDGIQKTGFDPEKLEDRSVHLFLDKRDAAGWARSRAITSNSQPAIAHVVINVKNVWKVDRTEMSTALGPPDLKVLDFLKKEGYDSAALEFPSGMKGNHVIVPDTDRIMLIGVEYVLSS